MLKTIVIYECPVDEADCCDYWNNGWCLMEIEENIPVTEGYLDFMECINKERRNNNED